MLFKNLKTLVYSALICYSVLLHSCAIQPPEEKGDFKESDLVELVELDQSFKLDIRYASNNNFVGRPVYTEARAFLQRPAALQLIKVNKELNELGYGLIIFDGYRPWSVTKTFWDVTSKENKKFVGNPKYGSRHNRGCAIDVSLFNLRTGEAVPMTGEYDEWSERSYPYYTGGTEQQREMRDLLREKMEANGFKVYEFEWWHFDFQGWEEYRIQNIPFSEIN